MTEENKNTVASVGMWFSIIGLIALITVVFFRLGFPLLFIGFILGIIGLFRSPRAKAWVATIIPLVVFGGMISVICYIWSYMKTPTMEFVDRAKNQAEQLNENDFDDDKFEYILNTEIKNVLNNKSEDEWKNLYENSTGANFVEKSSYLFFSVLQQGLEIAIEKYNNNELPEIIDEDTADEINEEIIDENTTSEIVDIFDNSEQNDIEQIINILE